jgi:hypothetical protein
MTGSQALDGSECIADGLGHWTLTTLREKLIKIGDKTARQGWYVALQMTKMAVPRELFAGTPRRVGRLRPRPLPT